MADTDDPADAHLVEHFLESQVRLTGGFLHVVCDTVRLPDGRTATREFIRHPGAVAVVPVLDDGRLVLVRQFRHPVSRILVEWPAGKLDADETSLVCAARELREETGYRAREFAFLGSFQNAAAYSSENLEIWLARGLVAGEACLDDGEFVEVSVHDEAQLDAWMRSGELSDMKTVLGLLALQRWRSGHWPLHWQPAPCP
jgi:ADP-ribose pyrophosphatase